VLQSALDVNMEASPLGKLPRELRDQIFGALLHLQEGATVASSVVMDRSPHFEFWYLPTESSGTMAACRQLRSECVPIFYETNTFKFLITTFKHVGVDYRLHWSDDIPPARWVSSGAEDWIECIGAEAAHKLRDVKVVMGVWKTASSSHNRYVQYHDLVPNIGRFARHIRATTPATCSIEMHIQWATVNFLDYETDKHMHELTLPTSDWQRARELVESAAESGIRHFEKAHAESKISAEVRSILFRGIGECYSQLRWFVDDCERWYEGEVVPNFSWTHDDASPARRPSPYHAFSTNTGNQNDGERSDGEIDDEERNHNSTQQWPLPKWRFIL